MRNRPSARKASLLGEEKLDNSIVLNEQVGVRNGLQNPDVVREALRGVDAYC